VTETLVSTTNTREAEDEIRSYAREKFGDGGDLVFEHGQWWLVFGSALTFSVVDCEKDGEHYIDFEQV